MADFGTNDNSLLARTHLGAVLHPGKARAKADCARAHLSPCISWMDLDDVPLVQKTAWQTGCVTLCSGAS